MKNYFAFAFAFSILANSAFADGIWLDQPSYGGTGCPQGTASATLSPDHSSLSLIYDQYTVEAGGSTGKRFDRKSCDVAIPVHIPQGYSVSIIEVDYRGFNAIPQGGFSQFNVEYFFAGSQGPSYQKRFVGPQNDNYTINNKLLAQAVVWSPCGAQVNLRTNSSILVATNSRQEDAMTTVDSTDARATLIYKLQWRQCNDQEASPTL